MLPEGSAILVPLEVLPIVDVEVGVLGVPLWIAEAVLFLQVFLWSPELGTAVRVLLCWERSGVLWDVHLIVRHHVVDTVVHLVLEEGVGHTQVVVWLHSDGQLTGDWIPRVLVHLPNWCITESHLGQLIVGGSRPQDLDLFALGIGDDLSGKVCLVTLVEDIESIVDDQVGEVDLLLRGESELLDPECLLARQTRCASHELLDVR